MLIRDDIVGQNLNKAFQGGGWILRGRSSAASSNREFATSSAPLWFAHRSYH
jgi:hypothetical protein